MAILASIVFAAAVEAGPSLPAACAYLWDRQARDGGWHSETYRLLESGQALSPFVLHALLNAPGGTCAAPAGRIERALGFLRRHVDADGVIGASDPDLLEYPNYSTAYALRCLVRRGGPSDRRLIKRMQARLVSEQYTEARGFTAASPVFGGWGFGGRHAPGRAGHMDIAHTRRVLQALHEAGGAPPIVFERALVFLRFMQRHPSETRPHPDPIGVTEPSVLPRRRRFDGGFFFSPVVLDANKGLVLADDHGAYHGSYATATADGLLALLAAGVSEDDERVGAARVWLESHAAVDHPEGIPTDGPQAWAQALDFYHLAVRAEAAAAVGAGPRAKEAIVRALNGRQCRDGSFVNDGNHLMKEDDPLLATALALIALS